MALFHFRDIQFAEIAVNLAVSEDSAAVWALQSMVFHFYLSAIKFCTSIKASATTAINP